MSVHAYDYGELFGGGSKGVELHLSNLKFGQKRNSQIMLDDKNGTMMVTTVGAWLVQFCYLHTYNSLLYRLYIRTSILKI